MSLKRESRLWWSTSLAKLLRATEDPTGVFWREGFLCCFRPRRRLTYSQAVCMNATKDARIHPFRPSAALGFLNHPAIMSFNGARLQALDRSTIRLDLTLPLFTHPLHRILLHRHNLKSPHPANIKNTVPSTAITTLRKVLVLTLHPSSFALSSHLSSFNEQMSGL